MALTISRETKESLKIHAILSVTLVVVMLAYAPIFSRFGASISNSVHAGLTMIGFAGNGGPAQPPTYTVARWLIPSGIWLVVYIIVARRLLGKPE
ncbi:hypothetical protein [Brevundimonas sp. M20]|uniref:hypothetical protein n=1 Tax=Brevundimonas sp. M20 TaxID=2591463 RepID=UPI00114694E6|nr:hypothetical protein [Brevundimonas sp. M20]QDH72606.1 hypothetical protein FKQ52_03660 [Brevundimonas sp. M20]